MSGHTPWSEIKHKATHEQLADARGELAKGTHPGFTIICDACDSALVIVNNDLGWSEGSGQFGSIELVCITCGQTTDIHS